MRHLTLLFALFALVWSGLHAEPAGAYKRALGDTSASAPSAPDDEDTGHSDRGGGAQHACHHHCPNAPAPRAPDDDGNAAFPTQAVFGSTITALRPIGRAPPLEPPIF